MEVLVEYLGKGFMVMLMISMPCVLMAALVGLVVGILQAVTQVPTARFCHVNRFMITADTKEDILQLVNQCLPKNE